MWLLKHLKFILWHIVSVGQHYSKLLTRACLGVLGEQGMCSLCLLKCLYICGFSISFYFCCYCNFLMDDNPSTWGRNSNENFQPLGQIFTYSYSFIWTVPKTRLDPMQVDGWSCSRPSHLRCCLQVASAVHLGSLCALFSPKDSVRYCMISIQQRQSRDTFFPPFYLKL